MGNPHGEDNQRGGKMNMGGERDRYHRNFDEGFAAKGKVF